MNATATNPSAGNPADTDPTNAEPAGPEPAARIQMRSHQLRRPADDRMLAGVAAGLAGFLGIDVSIVRIAFAVLAVVGGAGLPIYLAGWLLIPEEGSELSLASEFVQSLQSR
jgi:phage shock protein PspC (stress-responsive transcriptional regulator)